MYTQQICVVFTRARPRASSSRAITQAMIIRKRVLVLSLLLRNGFALAIV